MTKVNVDHKTRTIRITKERSTAVLLAVFLGFWAWLYTYKIDSSKFWAGLVISIVGCFLLFIPNIAVWIWAIIDTATKSKDMYKNYDKWKVK